MSPRFLALSIVIAGSAAAELSAQTGVRQFVPVATEAANAAGRFQGTVHDERGAGLGGVSILAAGATHAAATSDIRGRFQLDLPPGAYVVRAARSGYLSTYREVVDVRPYGWVERRIQLTRAESVAQPAAVPAPVTAGTVEQPTPADSGAGRGEVAWRLRHLARTVLRDVSPSAIPADTGRPFAATPLTASSLFDRTVQRSARAASSFLANTDFTGQLNLFTATSIAMPAETGAAILNNGPRGIADVIIGAPVGSVGDWSVHGAMLAGDATSWTLVGHYESRDEQHHPLRVAISYSKQGYVAGRDLPMSVVVPESRSAGGIRVADRWRVRPSIDLEYGLRYDRYDYLSEPNLFSPEIGVRARAFERTTFVASTVQHMIAPGADEFQSPSTTGPWLPPTRTFSSLSPRAGLQPERVRRHVVGLEHRLGPGESPAVSLEWFSESTANQLATLYGLDHASEVGHYYLAPAGNVAIVGWRVRLAGKLADGVRGAIEYASGDARWTRTRMAGALRRSAPALARRGLETISDLNASFDATVAPTATHLSVVYRLNTAGRAASALVSDRVGRGRFYVEISQPLPYQPLDAGVLNLLFTLRTLMHDDEAGSLYDEVLTERPPTRLTGGVQVRF